MDTDTINASVIAKDLMKDAEDTLARNGKNVVVALDRAQRAVADLGGRAFDQGKRVVERGAREVGTRPWSVALLCGGAVMAGMSYYLIRGARQR